MDDNLSRIVGQSDAEVEVGVRGSHYYPEVP